MLGSRKRLSRLVVMIAVVMFTRVEAGNKFSDNRRRAARFSDDRRRAAKFFDDGTDPAPSPSPDWSDRDNHDNKNAEDEPYFGEPCTDYVSLCFLWKLVKWVLWAFPSAVLSAGFPPLFILIYLFPHTIWSWIWWVISNMFIDAVQEVAQEVANEL
jgi:hypothetical protein